MKKSLLYLSLAGACLLGGVGATTLLNNTPHVEVSDGYALGRDINNYSESLSLKNGKYLSIGSSQAQSKVFQQWGRTDGGAYFLRCAVAISGEVSGVTYALSGAVTASGNVDTLYTAIPSSLGLTYYNGNKVVADASYKGQYMWAVGTYVFNNNSISGTITAKFNVTYTSGSNSISGSKSIMSVAVDAPLSLKVDAFSAGIRVACPADAKRWITYYATRDNNGVYVVGVINTPTASSWEAYKASSANWYEHENLECYFGTPSTVHSSGQKWISYGQKTGVVTTSGGFTKTNITKSTALVAGSLTETADTITLMGFMSYSALSVSSSSNISVRMGSNFITADGNGFAKTNNWDTTASFDQYYITTNGLTKPKNELTSNVVKNNLTGWNQDLVRAEDLDCSKDWAVRVDFTYTNSNSTSNADTWLGEFLATGYCWTFRADWCGWCDQTGWVTNADYFKGSGTAHQSWDTIRRNAKVSMQVTWVASTKTMKIVQDIVCQSDTSLTAQLIYVANVNFSGTGWLRFGCGDNNKTATHNMTFTARYKLVG